MYVVVDELEDNAVLVAEMGADQRLIRLHTLHRKRRGADADTHTDLDDWNDLRALPVRDCGESRHVVRLAVEDK
jgi:hypothetical protein